MTQRLRALMWDFIGLSLVILICSAFIEWINHDASWDGLYAAHVKHMGLAISQVGYNPFCDPTDQANVLATREAIKNNSDTRSKSVALLKTDDTWLRAEY